jgi:hypothetical protein
MNQELQELKEKLLEDGLTEEQIELVFESGANTTENNEEYWHKQLNHILNTTSVTKKQVSSDQPTLPRELLGMKFAESSESVFVPTMPDKRTQLNLLKSSIKDIKDQTIIDSIQKSISETESSLSIVDKIINFFNK